MENASKALIMSASMLLGLMIISVGVALFNSFGGFGKDITNKIEENKISEFNTQFLKYYGKSYNAQTQENETIRITTHDIVTLVNLAKKSNIENDVQDQQEENENTYYVRVNLKNKNKNDNLEKKTENELTRFIKENNIHMVDNELLTKYYYISDIKISNVTGRVIYIEIREFEE